jgi:N,N-dimethylformamidase beta subunit-like protein
VIRGYPARASVARGGRVVLHVATDAPRFRVRFHRVGEAVVPVHETQWLPGVNARPGRADVDWRWPAYEFSAADWRSGVYVAQLLTDDAQDDDASLAATEGAALFVVRGEGTRILYKLPIATYHAYNCTGGGCFYCDPSRSIDPPGSRVTLRRPGGGIGGDTFGAPDHYDATSARQTFAHWDAPFIRWLEREGFAADYCTDFDLHDGVALASGHRLLLCVGHDEYWSARMRDGVEAFIAGGGNVAFFGANLCWWRIHVVDGGTAIVCHQGGPSGALDHWWPRSGAGRPEDAMTGVSYRHGGGWWDGPRSARGYVVQQAMHWAFAGTNLADGQHFGETTRPPLVGYECDGAPLAAFDALTGRATLARDAARCGTPASFELLAVAPLTREWNELPPRERFGAGEGVHAATMGCYTRGGTVFTAGTTDWAQALEQDARVARITRNVIERLLASGSEE